MALSMGLLGGAAIVPAPAAFELLDSRILASAATGVSFTSMTQYAADYKHLQLRIVASGTRTGGTMELYGNVNGGTSYHQHYLVGSGSAPGSGNFGYTELYFGVMPGADDPNNEMAMILDMADAFDTSNNKTLRSYHGSTDAPLRIALHSNFVPSTAQINSFYIYPQPGGFGFAAGSRFSLYGLRG